MHLCIHIQICKQNGRAIVFCTPSRLFIMQKKSPIQSDREVHQAGGWHQALQGGSETRFGTMPAVKKHHGLADSFLFSLYLCTQTFLRQTLFSRFGCAVQRCMTRARNEN